MWGGLLDNVSAVLTVALLGILICGVTIPPILFLVTDFLTRPFNQLADSMNRFRGGDLDAPVPFHGHDEIGQLGGIF